jgi:predicted transposase YdaD
LNDAFLAWLKPLLVRTRFPEDQLQAIDDLYEVQTMLAERMQTWTQEWKQQGLEEGRKKGREEGREEGELYSLRRTLKKLLSQRFGTLPEHIEQQIERSEQPQLERWLDQVLVAPSLEALFPSG